MTASAVAHRESVRPKLCKRGTSTSPLALLCSGVLVAVSIGWSTLAFGSQACGQQPSVELRVDQGHPWRPPFGLERVGTPPVVHVEMASERAPLQVYYLSAFKDAQQSEQHELKFVRNPTNYSVDTQKEARGFFAHVPLTSVPSEVALYVRCGEETREVSRQAISWPEFEADAAVRADRRINPVDLGAILVPQDWLLLTTGESAVVEVAAVARGRDASGATIRAWFAGAKPVEVAFPLVRDERSRRRFNLPYSLRSDRSVLHVSVIDGGRQLWRKDIQTMFVAKPPTSPAFGAVEMKLRYDAPVAVTDPKTGGALPDIDYNTAWEGRLNDVVVFLPNHSRFVFWRGSSYVPFWAGINNTGISYQWSETKVPEAQRDSDAKDYYVEPLFDKELRHGRVRIVESTNSRIHVQWSYQLVDYRYKAWGDQATEDFFFYPDGFGTRVLTSPNTFGTFQQVSEFIILTPQATYPLEVMPTRVLDVLALDGEKGSITFPVPAVVTAPEGHDQTPMWSLPAWPLPVVNRPKPALYRIFGHKDDSAAAIYFLPRDTAPVMFLLPFYDQGQLVSPAYWGNHWPLSRGGWTQFDINDRVSSTPGHISLAAPFDGFWPAGYEPRPEIFESVGKSKMLDALGRPREMTIRRWTWLIANSDLPDQELQEWGKSFSAPPAVEVDGARLDFPTVSSERRAMRLVADSKVIRIRVKPEDVTVNPVFEIDQAPKELSNVRFNGIDMGKDAYAWDGKVLWIKSTIRKEGGQIEIRFR